MKRVRTKQVGFFPVAEVTKEIKRQRKPKNDEDPWLAKYKGVPPLEILKQFLERRKWYVQNYYPEQHKIVLQELELYSGVLTRIINNEKTKENEKRK